jgi:hypothetical protein
MRALHPVPVGERSILPGLIAGAADFVSLARERPGELAEGDMVPAGAFGMREAELFVGCGRDPHAGLGEIARLMRSDREADVLASTPPDAETREIACGLNVDLVADGANVGREPDRSCAPDNSRFPLARLGPGARLPRVRGTRWRVFMRSKLIGLLIGLGLAAVVAPALACNYHTTSASNDGATAQQTAAAQPAADAGSN